MQRGSLLGICVGVLRKYYVRSVERALGGVTRTIPVVFHNSADILHASPDISSTS